LYLGYVRDQLNPLTGILKPQSNRPLYSNRVVDGWAVTFGTAMRGMGGAAATPSSLIAVYQM